MPPLSSDLHGVVIQVRVSTFHQVVDADLPDLTRHFVDRAGLTVPIAFSPQCEPTTPARAIGNARDLTSVVQGRITASDSPTGNKSHEPSNASEIQAVIMYEMLRRFNDLQIIHRVETATCRGSQRDDEPLFLVKTEGRYREV